MTRMNEAVQGGGEYHVARCWCSEHTYLEVSRFDPVGDTSRPDFTFTITMHPSRWRQRWRLAWRVLRGLEFAASNSVMVQEADFRRLLADLQRLLDQRPKPEGYHPRGL